MLTHAASEKSLAHAIVIVDHLVKFRSYVASSPLPLGLPDSEANSAAAIARAFLTGTIFAMVVCPTRSQALEVFNIYKPLCEKVDISVSRFATPHDHEILDHHLKHIKSSKAVIAIGTVDCLRDIAFRDIQFREVPRPCSTPEETRAMMYRMLRTARRILINTKVVVIESCDEFLVENWTEPVHHLTNDMRRLMDPSHALIVLSQRPLETQDNAFTRWLGFGEQCVKRFVADNVSGDEQVIAKGISG